MVKTGKRLFLALAIFFSLFVLASCDTANALRIKLGSEEYDLVVGDVVEVDVEVTKDGVATSTELGYKSFDESVVTFEDGKLTALAEGQTQIKVYSMENPLYDAVATVTVSFAQSLHADFQYSYEMLKGDTQQIVCNLALDSKDAIVTYESLNKNIVSVDNSGNVLGLAFGTGKIVARVSYAKDPNQYREYVLEVLVSGTRWNLSWELNGGSCEELPEFYVEGTGIEELPTPTREHYDFLGWYRKVDFSGDPITAISQVDTGAKKYYANWKAVEYTITYETNEGELSETAVTKYTVETAGFELLAPVRKGYDFLGWYDNAELTGEPVTVVAEGESGNKAYYAKWELERFDVKLDLAGGSFADAGQSTELKLNKTESLPIPTYPGYIFLGWYLGEEKVEHVSADCTLVAKWELGVYDVKLDLAGGIFEGKVTTLDQFGDEFIKEFNAITGKSLTKEGFHANTGTPIKTFFGNAEMLEKYQWLLQFAKEMITAKYEAAEMTYNSEVYEGTMAMIEKMLKGDTTAISASDGANGRTMIRHFIHNLINADYSKPIAAQGDFHNLSTDFSLAENQAKFWNAYLGTELEVTVNDELPVAIREGHVFLGWYLGEEKVEHATQDCTLTAKWEIITFAIKYDLNGGQWGEEEGPVSFGYNVFTSLVDPVREGYEFLGWISNDKYVTVINKNEEYALTAKWKANDATGYEIIFDLNGGAFAGSYAGLAEFGDEFIKEFNTVTGKSLTKEGFHNNTGTPIKTFFGNAEMLEKYQWLLQFAKEMITAKYEAAEMTYNSEVYEGTMAMIEKMLKGDTTAISASDGANGRTMIRHFIHNLINADYSKPNAVQGDFHNLSTDFSLAENQAKFLEMVVPKLQQTIEPDQELPTPVLDKHVFLGWYVGEEKIDKVYDDHVLVAKWVHEDEVEYEVSFVLDGGSLESGYATISDWAKDFLKDWEATGAALPEVTDFNKSTSASIKKAFGNAEMLAKYKWLLVFAKSTIEAQVDPSDTNLALISAMLQGMIEGKTEAISVSDGGVGRTALRYWLHSLLNAKLITVEETSGSTQHKIYVAYALDFSLAENQAKFWDAYNASLTNIYTPKDALPTPTKEGHLFLGWYNGEEKVEVVRGNWTLTAKWAKYEDVKYTIKYNLAGGQWGEVEGTTEFHHNQEVTLATPVREGYKFLGWYSDDKEVTTIGNASYELTAVWEEIPEVEYVPVVRVVDANNPEAYATIDAALAEAKPGDTISLVAGNYGTVTIYTRGITLAGPNAGINPNTQSRAEEAVFTGDVIIAADEVTLDGIQLTGAARVVGSPTVSISDLIIINLLVAGTTISGSTNAPLYFVPTVTGVSYSNTYISNMRAEQASDRIMIMLATMMNGITVLNSEFYGTSDAGVYNDGFKFNMATDKSRVIDYEYDIKGEVTFIGNKIVKYCQYPVWFATYGEGTYTLENNTFSGSALYTDYNDACFCFTTYKEVDASQKVKINVTYNTTTGSGILVRIQAAGLDQTKLEAHVNYNKIYSCVHTLFVSDNDKNTGDYIDATNNFYDKTPTAANFKGVSAWEPYYTDESQVPSYGTPAGFETIKYELGGGQLPESYPAGYDPITGLSVLPTPTREGYTFEGWYLEGKLVTGIAKGTKGEVTLVAAWKEIALYVGTGEGQYATIAEALAAAKEGDKIIILAGEYTEDINITIPNLTILGPNANINPNTGVRDAEAILKGKITIAASGYNLKLAGLAFTGDASITGGQVVGLTFENNYAYDTTDAPNAWAEGSGYTYGFIYFNGASSSTQTANLEFFNNRFENVSEANITLSYAHNVSFDGNVFKNFDRDAIRFNHGGYNNGVLSFTNNEFVQDSLGGYNGIYFRIYGGTTNDTTIYIANNKFINIGNKDAGLYSGAISARNYQELGADIDIVNNYFEKCYNYIRIRNNGTAPHHAASTWSCYIDNNQFIGLPNSYYYAQWNNDDKDTTENPILTQFGANYYEDNEGKVISDLSTYESYFKQVANKGTALAAKPGESAPEVLEFWTIQYELDGGKVEGTFVNVYSNLNNAPIAIPTPEKDNHQFLGWNLNGNLVKEIPADAKGDLVLVAEYSVLEGEIYNVTLIDKDSLGSWPTRAAKNKDEIITLLLADMYEWAKGNGETGTYEEWYAATWAIVVAKGDLKLRNPQVGPYVSADGSTDYFLNSPAYFDKWVGFFILFDKAQLYVNGSQPFFKTDTASADTSASNVRFSEFLQSTRAKLDYYMADMCEAVRVEEERLSSYRGGQIIELPVLTNKLGLEFLGWYDNAEFAGSPVTSIVATDTGDKTYYAKWEAETVATSVELNKVDKIKRYETYQLVWSFTPENTTYKEVEFFSSDPSIASVGVTSGLITAHKNGEVVITMRVYSNRELDVEFTLTVYSPDHIQGSYETESLVVKNETIKLNAVNAYIKDATITWSSSNSDIAYVDATSGVVTGVKAGLATITATSKDSVGNEIKLDFIVTVVDKALEGVLGYIASQNEANVFTRYDLPINGNYPFLADIFGSVNRVLFNDKLNVNTEYVAKGDAGGEYYTDSVKNGGLEFITVHYTANNSTSAGALTHAKYFTNGNGVSIHYTTGNDGVYQALSHDHGAWHAGDSGALSRVGEFKWNATGVKYDGTPLLEVKFTVSDDFYYEINGQKTSVKLPDTWNYVYKDVPRNTDHIYNADGTISSQSDYTGTKFTNREPESFLNTQDLPITVKDGEYYMGTTWWSYTQVHEGRICGTGGNRNSIGIESAVNAGSDLWLTWQKTAQLVASLMAQYDLDISRVKGHHFFDGKNCPQPMLENNMEIWWEFLDLVQAEHEMITKYSGYEITCVSNNKDLVSDNGRVIKQPEVATCVTYTLTIKDTSGNTQTITLASMIGGIYEE